MKNKKEQFEEWKNIEAKKLSRQPIGSEETKAKRSYIHFDHRRGEDDFVKYRDIFLNPLEIKKKIAFWPFLKIELKEPRIKNKPNGKKRKKEIKKRSVYYAAHQDALLYSWYSFILNSLYERILHKKGINEHVTAYRKMPRKDSKNKNKCNIHFAKDVFDFLKGRNEECVAIVADITGFFDNLDHDHLRTEWKYVLGLPNDADLPEDHEIIYNNLTRFKYVNVEDAYKAFKIKFKIKKIKDKDNKTKIIRIPIIDGKPIKSILEPNFSRKDFVSRVVKGNLIKGNENWNKTKKCHKGIMQGAPISATLANIYMLSFDEKIAKFLKKRNGLYMRYSDDIVAVCDKKDFEDVKIEIFKEIENYQLEINPTKVDYTFFKEAKDGRIKGYDESNELKKLQYLGFEFDGHNVFIKSKSLAKYYRKMKSKIRKAASMAFGKRSKTKDKGNKVFKKQLHEKFLKKGKRSFISYALRADEIMGGGTIKKQLSKRGKIMADYLFEKQKKHFYRHKRLQKSINASNKRKEEIGEIVQETLKK